MKVLETLNLSYGYTVLITEWFDDNIITNKLLTNIGVLEKSNFYVEHPRPCFSNPTNRLITLRKHFHKGEITTVEFI